MQTGAQLSWKSVLLDLIDEPHRERLERLLDTLDPPTESELHEFGKALDLARARCITSKVFLHPSFVHLLGDLAGVAGVVNLLRGITVAYTPRDRGGT